MYFANFLLFLCPESPTKSTNYKYNDMANIAIFASGTGTNAENIMTYFKHHPKHQVGLVLSNKTNAEVLNKAKKHGIDCFTFSKSDFYESDRVLNKLKEKGINFIALAGFLWLVPDNITKVYAGKMVNIHPALLPKYGGKGMYGKNVHRAVLEANDKKSGITIHKVNEKYDEGDIVFQASCDIDPGETEYSLADKVHKLEYRHYPKIIEQVLDETQ